MENNLYVNQEKLIEFIHTKLKGLEKNISKELIDLILDLEMEYLFEKGIAVPQ